MELENLTKNENVWQDSKKAAEILKEQKETELEETGSLLTGNDDIMRAVFWGYHDGAWAEGITDHGEDYLNKYDELSAIDSYACVVDYIENGLC